MDGFSEVVGYETESDFPVHVLAEDTTCLPWVSGRREVIFKSEDLGVRQLWS